MQPVSSIIRIISAKVRKGQIRSSVLRLIKDMEQGVANLRGGAGIKKEEIEEYKNNDKTNPPSFENRLAFWKGDPLQSIPP